MNSLSKSVYYLIFRTLIMTICIFFLSSCTPIADTKSISVPTLTADGTKVENDSKAEAHEEMKRGETRAKIIIDAIEKYKRDKGKYPDTLEELVPDYLKEIPQTDTKQNYQYRLSDLGYFELWFSIVTEKRAGCAYSNRFEDWECGYTAEP